MYLHFVVPTGREWKPFCGHDALARAKAFAGEKYPIWSMTKSRSAMLGLLDPKTAHQLSEVAMESDVLYALAGSQAARHPF